MRTRFNRQVFLIAGLYLWLTGFPVSLFSQYILNGSATQNTCNCYTLTPALNTQSGSVWNSNKINLTNSFDFTFNVFLGCQDSAGADGIVFILQPVSTSLGTSGGGMGFEGITPSVGIALDTWQNTINNDPFYDHVSIQANGVITHGSDLAGPVQALPSQPNIEDCSWHTFRIRWDASSFLLEVYVDGMFRLSYTGNLVASFFNNDPMVFWGFTAATGGANNLQQFCTALNPDFSTNFTGNTTCNGNNVFNFQDQSVSFAPIQAWYWDFGDGTTSNLQSPPPHLYPAPGIYQVRLVITGLDGCISDTLKRNIVIGTKPIADFQVYDTCSGKPLRVEDRSTNQVGNISQWTWILDGSPVSSNQQPQITNLAAGPHQLKLVVKSEYGCESDTVTKSFNVKPVPVVNLSAADGCFNQPISFSAFQLDNNTTITQWNWIFGDGTGSTLQNPVHTYAIGGNKNIVLTAIASNGCVSEPVNKTISVAQIFVKTLNDTIVLKNIPFTVSTSWGGNSAGIPFLSWSPSTGLDIPVGFAPTATLQDDITYVVTATSVEGCVAMDTVHIKVFKGSAVYVPTGFTPNQDGLNDKLRPVYVGIKRLDYFRVYNRWGQLVFSTSNLSAGWDGKLNGTPQQTGTFVWMIRAEDIAGKIYEIKGTTTLIH